MVKPNMELVESGPLRSERELTRFLQVQTRCPACSGLLITHVREQLPPGSRHALILPTTCSKCARAYRLAFTAGPGFDRRPPPEDPRLALTDVPSAILPEEHFRRQSRDLFRALEADTDSTSRRMWASGGLSDLFELEKFAHARGERLSEEDDHLLRRFAKAFVENAGKLPADLAARFADMQPALCGQCNGRVTWISGELVPRSGYRAHVHCAPCGTSGTIHYQTAKVPPNLPPKGAVFFDRIEQDEVGDDVALPFYAPAVEVPQCAESTTAPMCESFGYKCAWFAIKAVSAAAIVDELLGPGAKRVTWKDGVAEAYRGGVFVSPSAGGWVFVVSTAFFELVDDPSAVRKRVGAKVQFFASDPVIGVHVAIDDTGKRIEVRDEEKIMKLAGRWGKNPQTLGSVESNGELGWVATELACVADRRPATPRFLK